MAGDFTEIPKLDLSDFVSGNAYSKQKFISDLGQAYENIGFAAIRNHGINHQLLSGLYRAVADFFCLPSEIKNQYNDEAGGGQRGYTGFGKEHAKGNTAADLKEFWHFGQYIEESDPLFSFYPPNKEVAEVPEFNQKGKEIYLALEQTGILILRALALHLHLNEDYFDEKVKGGNSILRPIYYPPIKEEPRDSIRAAEHEDINLITLLVGASAEGLEVLNRSGVWIPVTEVENHIIVNVGDMLQRLTNNKLVSTTHRVVNPPKEQWYKPRYSIPFFLHPRPEVSLACLESCVDTQHPRLYEDCTANEFLMERLREIGLLNK